jgi:uridine kinase
MARDELLQELAKLISSIQLDHSTRVAIDGVDCSGKTTLANELADVISQIGFPVIRASIDGFHHPRAHRYQLGPDSPEGFFLHSFNYPLVKELLLDPLGSGGNCRFCTAAFDVRADIPVPLVWQEASPNSIVLVDGIFLLRPELIGCWDYRVFLDVDFRIVLKRAGTRDQYLFGNRDAVEAQYQRRYIPGQKIYFQTCHPLENTDLVIDNNDFENPRIKR